MDWQLDPLSGGRFDGVDRASSPLLAGSGPDLKGAWAIGRGESWVALACGAIASPADGEDLARAFLGAVADFADHNPPGHGVQWASPMEAGLRVVCLGQAQVLLRGREALRSGEHALGVARLAVATARLLLTRLEHLQAVPNNHLVANWVGLLACAALLPSWPEARGWSSRAAAGLRGELFAQTHADGTSFEGSVPYHRLALELFLSGAILARRAGEPLGRRCALRLRAMFAAARGLLFSEGDLPQIGDDDSGRVLAFHQRSALDGRHLLPLGAALTGIAALRVRPGVADAEEVLWLLGPRAVDRLALAPAGPPPRTATYSAGGFHLLRRGRMELALSCGRSGQRGVGGHSHNDRLAFELRVGGKLVVCDPGSPSYTGDPRLRELFRSTRAHATVVVDGLEQSPLPPGRPFALPDRARAAVLAVASTARGELVVGEHRGFAAAGAVHRRQVRLQDDGAVLEDAISGRGVHRLEVRFPLPSDEARLRALTSAERLRVAELAPEAAPGGVEGVEIGPADAPRALLVICPPDPLAPKLEPSGYSPGYGELTRALTAVAAGQQKLPAKIVTIVLPLEPRRTPDSRPEERT